MATPCNLWIPPHFLRGLFLVLGVWLLLTVGAAGEPSADQDRELVQREAQLWQQIRETRRQNHLDESLAALYELVETEARLAGGDTETAAFLAHLRTDLEKQRGDWGSIPAPQRGLLIRCRMGCPQLFTPSTLPGTDHNSHCARAERLVKLREEVFGATHLWVALAQMDLALAQRKAGRFEQAAEHWSQALSLLNGLPADEDTAAWRYEPLVKGCRADCRHWLAALRLSQGDFNETKHLLGDGKDLLLLRDRWIDNRCLLAEVYLATGDREALTGIPWKEMSAAWGLARNGSVVMTEQDQLSLAKWARSPLDLYLSFRALDTGRQPMDPSLAWSLSNAKGSVLIEQSRLRSERRHPSLAPLFQELEEVNRQLAGRTAPPRNRPDDAAGAEEVASLLQRREKLEVELARRRYRLPQMLNQPGHEQIPAGSTLLDFYEYEFHGPPLPKADTPWSHHLACLIGRKPPREPGGPVSPKTELHLVDLGPVEPVREAVRSWRSAIEHGGGAGRGMVRIDPQEEAGDREYPAVLLRQHIWEPLRLVPNGSETVFISPDGVLSFVPFAALPGSKPGTFLIEERPLVNVPIPQLLTPFLANLGLPREQRPRPLPDDAPRMLLVGGVDYGESSPTSRWSFAALPGTLRETDLIRQQFVRAFPHGEALVLEGKAATVSAVRRESPQCRWIHLATHGFFLPAEHPLPMLDSGLVLAGANAAGPETPDTGLLTALDLAEFDLQGTQLAVLSACETSLGEARRGEGVRGLQAALQLAGARATITSLWKVHDQATQALMVEMYRNLWERKLPPPEALRQAQLAMLHGNLYRPLGARTEPGSGQAEVVAPFYWAAFVLSGDGR